ncbi:MAG: hypothetical protein DRP64_00220 [Verrucomicrobia bacterium]|nr:MAG: hypothetical protein DRP64_00220 [Verrucomicrobiota bacterium]
MIVARLKAHAPEYVIDLFQLSALPESFSTLPGGETILHRSVAKDPYTAYPALRINLSSRS